MKNSSESFFRELAKAYAENEGEVLKNELEEIEREHKAPHSSELDRKIKNKLTMHKFRSYGLRALPVTASLIIALFAYNIHVASRRPPVSEPPASTPIAEAPAASEYTPNELQYSVELISVSLPVGYTLTGIDYDNEAAIMEIMNDERNRIVITAEGYRDFNTDAFTELTINGGQAYGLIKNDYSVLKYRKGDMLYTLTSKYNYSDLIEISKNII